MAVRSSRAEFRPPPCSKQAPYQPRRGSEGSACATPGAGGTEPRPCLEHPRDGAGEALGEGYVQELVRAVGVGMGSEHARGEDLRPGKAAAEHLHERDRAPRAEEARLRAEELPGGALPGLRTP